jgi:hypothetical protein
MPVIDGLPVPEALRQVPPRAARPGTEEDPVDHRPVITPPAALPGIGGQERPQPQYLTKHVADCHQAQTDAQRAHVERLTDALQYEPCSPRCANWLRHGVQPKNARPGLTPGACKGKAHRREYLGYAGRRVLVSRKWSGNTLADHRADRKNWLLSTLGVQADPVRYAWEPVTTGDPDHMEHARRLLHVVADRQRWQAALAEARRWADIQPGPDLSATGEAA